VAIEQIKPGDLVLSRSEFDPSAPVEAKVVEEVFVRVAPVLDLRGGNRTITTTDEHPFFAEGRGWVPAKFLKSGSRVLGLDREWLLVEGVDDKGQVTAVYNFRVADWHTYFVGNAAWGFAVWAHNAECVLYHGSRDGIVGGEMSLTAAAASGRATHLTQEGVFFTDEFARAATQYATPGGDVARVVIPEELAAVMLQFDRYGNPEYVAKTAAQIEAINREIQILPQPQAIRAWWGQ
jgi:hypothetical protein